MKLVTTTIAAALFGLSLNAVAAVSDLSSVTHAGAEMGSKTVGGQDAISSTDLTAVTHGSASNEAKQVGRYSANNYRFGDINSVTHN